MRSTVLSFVAGALAAMLACGGDDRPTTPVAPTPTNRGPQVAQAVPDQTLTLGEYERVNIDLDSHFTDPDGDALAYEAVSSNTHVADARVSGSTVTLAANHLGRADIRVTARDPGGLTATERFSLTVERGSPRAELEITLCQAEGLGVVDVVVEGIVRAVTRLSAARVIAYVDAHRLGEQTVGDVPAGAARSFAIRGTAPVNSASECHVEFLAGQRTLSVNAPVAFR